MSAELLERAGVALHGIDWKHKTAHDLGVSPRNVRRWANNEVPVPPGIWRLLRALLIAHSLRCRDIAVELPK